MTQCAHCGTMLMVGFTQVPAGYMALCGACKQKHDATIKHELTKVVCSCGSQFSSLDEIRAHVASHLIARDIFGGEA